MYIKIDEKYWIALEKIIEIAEINWSEYENACEEAGNEEDLDLFIDELKADLFG